MNSFETYRKMRELLSSEEKIIVDCYVEYLVDRDQYIYENIYDSAINFMRSHFTLKFDCSL